MPTSDTAFARLSSPARGCGSTNRPGIGPLYPAAIAPRRKRLSAEAHRRSSSARVHLIQRHAVRLGDKRCEVGRTALRNKTTKHRRGSRVHLIHRRQPENQFHRAQQAGLVVLSVDGLAAFCVRADDIRRGAVAAHVVPSALRVVFDGENARVFPEPAVTDGFDDTGRTQGRCRPLARPASDCRPRCRWYGRWAAK